MRSITLTQKAVEDLDALRKGDAKLLSKVITLLTEIASNPFTGTGKPELLKHQLKGKWSRRINEEHRLVYEVQGETILVLSCRHHYE